MLAVQYCNKQRYYQVQEFQEFRTVYGKQTHGIEQGLNQYLQLHPGRLVYDTVQNPEFRPRMSTAQGVLQTLTTGVSSLWSTSRNRFIRAGLKIAIVCAVVLVL